MAVFRVVLLLSICVYVPTAVLVLLRERRQGKVVYQRNRESEPAREVTPRRFFYPRLMLVGGPAIIGLNPLIGLHLAIWAVVVYIASADRLGAEVVPELHEALVVLPLRRSRHRQRLRFRLRHVQLVAGGDPRLGDMAVQPARLAAMALQGIAVDLDLLHDAGAASGE